MDYLIKASVVIALFYLCFYFFLKKETFFQHNRRFLLIGLVIALVFPLIVIPIYIPIEPIVIPETIYAINENTTNTIADIQSESVFEWASLISVLYAVGLFVLCIQFLFQFSSLILLLIRNPKNKDGIYTYVIVENKISPFSFFKWIVYNPENYDTDELQLILIHEKVHANQMHSIDILFTQLACVIFWFNPMMWLYRKEVRQNLEYIADFKTQTISKNEKEYQHLLLKTSVVNHNISISNNFYNSLIKERIVMLKKSRSNKKKQLRYLLIIPLLAGLLMSMNTKEIYVESENSAFISNEGTPKVHEEKAHKAILKPDNLIKKDIKGYKNKSSDYKKSEISKKTKPSKSKKKALPTKSKTIAMAAPKKIKEKSPLASDISITLITKNTTDSELDEIKEQLKKEGLTAKFKRVKRNKKGEITAIKIEVKSKKTNANYNINSDEAIDPVKIIYNEEKNSISIDNGHSAHEKNSFVYETKGGKHKLHKSGNSSHVYVISEDEHEHDEEHGDEHEHEHEQSTIYVTRAKGKKGKLKRIKKSKNVHVISGDDGEVIEIMVDEDEDDNKKTIILNGKANVKVEGRENIVVKRKSKNVWVTNLDDKDDNFFIEIDDSKKNIYISNDNGKKPLYIIDGKEVSKNKFANIKPNSIESVNVLKGKSAIKMYGEKGKDGVIIITTKKKN